MIYYGEILPPETRRHLCFAFLLNGLWLIVNGLATNKDQSFWSAVFVLLMYAVTLWIGYISLNVEYWKVTMGEILTIYAPISMHLSWVTLAALVNLSNTLMNDTLDFTLKENRTAIGGPDWSMGVLLFATLLATYLAATRDDFVYAITMMWALQGVMRQQSGEKDFPHPTSIQLYEWARNLLLGIGVVALVGIARALVFRKPTHMKPCSQDCSRRPTAAVGTENYDDAFKDDDYSLNKLDATLLSSSDVIT